MSREDHGAASSGNLGVVPRSDVARPVLLQSELACYWLFEGFAEASWCCLLLCRHGRGSNSVKWRARVGLKSTHSDLAFTLDVIVNYSVLCVAKRRASFCFCSADCFAAEMVAQFHAEVRGLRISIKSVPLMLTGLRALLAPVVVLLSLFAPLPPAFGVCLVAAFLSDVFDGVLARRLKIATANLRRLDSVADTLFYAACVFAAWHLYSAVVCEHKGSLAVLGGLEVIRYALDFLKFRREASYHMWSSKVWGIALFAGFFGLLVMGSPGVAVSCAIYLGIVADLEGLFISIVLPRWQADVPTLVHAWRLRRAEAG